MSIFVYDSTGTPIDDFELATNEGSQVIELVSKALGLGKPGVYKVGIAA